MLAAAGKPREARPRGGQNRGPPSPQPPSPPPSTSATLNRRIAPAPPPPVLFGFPVPRRRKLCLATHDPPVFFSPSPEKLRRSAVTLEHPCVPWFPISGRAPMRPPPPVPTAPSWERLPPALDSPKVPFPPSDRPVLLRCPRKRPGGINCKPGVGFGPERGRTPVTNLPWFKNNWNKRTAFEVPPDQGCTGFSRQNAGASPRR